MTDVLKSLLVSASSLQSKLGAIHHNQPSRPCADVPLALPSASSIEQQAISAGASKGTAKHVSDAYMSSVAALQQATLQEYSGTLVDLRDSHDLCSSTTRRQCPILTGVRDSFMRVYVQKCRSMLDQTLAQVKERCARKIRPAVKVQDHTPILEYAYTQSKKPTAQEKLLLSQVTGLTTKQVNVWFQNRRTREKAGAGTKHQPPRSIEELGERLRHQQRLYDEFSARKCEDESGNESHDSGYASAGSLSSSSPTVKDITNMLKAFHIDDDVKDLPAPKQKSKAPRKAAAKRSSTTSEENLGSQAAAARPATGKPKRAPAQRSSSSVPPTEGDTPRPVAGRAPTRPKKRDALQASQSLGLPTTSPAQSVAATAGHTILKGRASAVATNEAAATSSNKATRSRKKAALPARRPKASRSTRGVQVASSSSSGSSVPSLSPSSSRSSSLSSDPFFDLFSSPTPFSAPLPQTEPVYYTKNANGEFVPVTAPIVVRPQIAVPPPVHIGYPDLSLDLESLFDHPSLGPVGPQMVAPDSDPRAFSSNILGSTMEPVITTEDFSALLELLSENAGDASTSGTSALDLTSAMPPLQGPPLNAGHDASSIAPIPDPVSDYDFGSVVWPEFDETSWSQLLGLA